MKLLIPIISYNFAEYLIREIQTWLYINLDQTKLISAQCFINLIDERVNLKDVFYFSLNCLVIKKYDNRLEIVFNESIKVPQTNLKLINILKLINYGNTIVTPYPIYTNMFNYFEKNIETCYNRYIMFGG